MKNLEDCRKKIDEIDEQLIKLFEERMNISVEVALYKMENNLPIFNVQRENEVIEKNVKRLENRDLQPYVEIVLHCLMDVSKDFQKTKMGDK